MPVDTRDLKQALNKYEFSESSMPALDLAALKSLTSSSADVVEAADLEDYCDALAEELGCTETQLSVSKELLRNIKEQQRTGVYNEVKISDTKTDSQNHSVSVVCLKAQWSADGKQVFVAYVQQGVSWTPKEPSCLEGEETMHHVLRQLKMQALTNLLANVQTSEPAMLTAAKPATRAALDVVAEEADRKGSVCLQAGGSAEFGSDIKQDLAKYRSSESSMPALDLAAFSSLTSSSADTVGAADLEDYCEALAEELGCKETQSSVSQELRRNIREQQTTGVYNEVKIMETQSNTENHSVSITCLKAQWSADGKEVWVAHVQQGVSWTPSAPSGAQLAIKDEENMQRVLTQLKVQALTNLETKVQTSAPTMLTTDGGNKQIKAAGTGVRAVDTQDMKHDLDKYGGSESLMPALDLAAFASLTSSSADTVDAADLEDYCDALAEELGCTETQPSVSQELLRNIKEQQRTGVYNEVKISETKSDAQNHSVSVVCLKARWSADGKQVFVAYVQQGVSWTPTAPSRLEGEENMHRVLRQLKVQALTDLVAKVQTSEPGMLTAAKPATEPDGKGAGSGSANMMAVDTQDTRQDLAKDVGSESSMPALDLAKFSSLTSSGADTVEAADLEDYCDALAEELGCTETQSSVSRELRRNIQEQQTTGVYNEVKIMETQSNAENHSVSITCLKAQWSADGKEVRVVHVQQGVSWTPSAPSGAQLAINDEENMQRVLTQLKVQALTNLEARVQTSTPRIGAISG